jgi:hypothetical protein
MTEPQFSKVLAKFYIRWFNDCCDSAVYCKERGNEPKAKQYLNDASRYLTIIIENWEAIEFFSNGDNAFKYDAALPEKFRGY